MPSPTPSVRRGEAAVRNLRSADTWQTTVPSSHGQPEPVDRGEGRHRQPRARQLLIISGEKDHTVPPSVANASYEQQDNQASPRSSRSRTVDCPHHPQLARSRRHRLAFVNDSHSRAGADPSERYAYAPTMAGHRDIGLGTRDDDPFPPTTDRVPVATRPRCIAKPNDPG
jgi:fermentation-respiration switch protein FrsA (DUF1100 family)